MIERTEKLIRATAEEAKEFDELYDKYMSDCPLTRQEAMKMKDRIDTLIMNYDWTNEDFIDPVTGKKGLRDVTGKVLIPPKYDGFIHILCNDWFYTCPQAAKKDGKWGIVAADGTGKEITDFRFTYLIWNPFVGMFQACWGDSKKFGFVTSEGEVFIPNVLTKCHHPWNDFMLLEGDGKFGAYDVYTHNYVLPEYEYVDDEPDQDVVFYKDGVAGYIIQDTGEFVPKDRYETDEEYIDTYLYNTYVNI